MSRAFRFHSYYAKFVSSLCCVTIFFTTVCANGGISYAQNSSLHDGELIRIYDQAAVLKTRECSKYFPEISDRVWPLWNQRLTTIDAFLDEVQEQIKKGPLTENQHEKLSCVAVQWMNLQSVVVEQVRKKPECFPSHEGEIISFSKDYRACEAIYDQAEIIFDHASLTTIQKYGEVGESLVFAEHASLQNTPENEANLGEDLVSMQFLGQYLFAMFNQMSQQIRSYRLMYLDLNMLKQVFEESAEHANRYDETSAYLSKTFEWMGKMREDEKIKNITAVDAASGSYEKIPEITFEHQPTIATAQLSTLDADIMSGMTLSSIKHAAFQIWSDLEWKYGKNYFKGWQRKVPKEKLNEERKKTGKSYYYGEYRSEVEVAFRAVCSFESEFGDLCKSATITSGRGVTHPFRDFVSGLYSEYALQRSEEQKPDDNVNKRKNLKAYDPYIRSFNEVVNSQRAQCSEIHDAVQSAKKTFDDNANIVDMNGYFDVEQFSFDQSNLEFVIGSEKTKKFKNLYDTIIGNQQLGKLIQDEQFRKDMRYNGYDQDLLGCAKSNESWTTIRTDQAISTEDRIRTTRLDVVAKMLQRNIALSKGQTIDVDDMMKEVIENHPLVVIDYLLTHPSKEYATEIARLIRNYSLDKRNNVILNRTIFAFTTIVMLAAAAGSLGWLSPGVAAAVGFVGRSLFAVSLLVATPIQIIRQSHDNQMMKEALALETSWDFSTLIQKYQEGLGSLRSAQVMELIQLGLAPLVYFGPVRSMIQRSQAEKLLTEAKQMKMIGDVTPKVWDDLMLKMQKNPYIVFEETPASSKLIGRSVYPNHRGVSVVRKIDPVDEMDDWLDDIDPWDQSTTIVKDPVKSTVLDRTPLHSPTMKVSSDPFIANMLNPLRGAVANAPSMLTLSASSMHIGDELSEEEFRRLIELAEEFYESDENPDSLSLFQLASRGIRTSKVVSEMERIKRLCESGIKNEYPGDEICAFVHRFLDRSGSKYGADSQRPMGFGSPAQDIKKEKRMKKIWYLLDPIPREGDWFEDGFKWDQLMKLLFNKDDPTAYRITHNGQRVQLTFRGEQDNAYIEMNSVDPATDEPIGEPTYVYPDFDEMRIDITGEIYLPAVDEFGNRTIFVLAHPLFTSPALSLDYVITNADDEKLVEDFIHEVSVDLTTQNEMSYDQNKQNVAIVFAIARYFKSFYATFHDDVGDSEKFKMRVTDAFRNNLSMLGLDEASIEVFVKKAQDRNINILGQTIEETISSRRLTEIAPYSNLDEKILKVFTDALDTPEISIYDNQLYLNYYGIDAWVKSFYENEKFTRRDKEKFLDVIRKMEDDPYKLWHLIQTLVMDQFSDSQYVMIQKLIESDGLTIENSGHLGELEMMRQLFSSMANVSKSEGEKLNQVLMDFKGVEPSYFEKYSQSKMQGYYFKGKITHLSEGLYDFYSDIPFERNFTVNIFSARKVDPSGTKFWVEGKNLSYSSHTTFFEIDIANKLIREISHLNASYLTGTRSGLYYFPRAVITTSLNLRMDEKDGVIILDEPVLGYADLWPYPHMSDFFKVHDLNRAVYIFANAYTKPGNFRFDQDPKVYINPGRFDVMLSLYDESYDVHYIFLKQMNPFFPGQN